ncbi:MAG: ATP-binding protein, partial [Candidatus Kariarchaeaceae archaeon]
IDQLLVFSRKKVQEVKSLEMNHIIEDLYLILDKLVGGTISLKLELDSNELYFKCDTTQINQVVMNLVQNARDAIEQSGVISIRTYAEVREEDNSLLQYVVLEVEDTGTGISAEDMVHIYEPFYTTKDQGKGTGLGLSMVYGVVTQYDGVIEVDTELGRGTLFKIYFPLTPAPRATSESILPGIHKSSRTEGKVILVVEDDNQVRSMMDKVLTASGYNVISAVNGKEAQSICDDLSIHIDLMITDIVMPQMNGTDLALYSTYKRPNMQILLISGYPESDLFEHSTGDLNLEELPYLKKPFSSEELLARLQSMISLSREV